MTVKELNEVLEQNAVLNIVDTNGCIISINRRDPLPLAAYGDFIIAKIWTTAEGVDIDLALQPIKKG